MAAGQLTGVNIEIKARARDRAGLLRLARALTEAPEETLEQRDVFFERSRGRRKLRNINNERAELIASEREPGDLLDQAYAQLLCGPLFHWLRGCQTFVPGTIRSNEKHPRRFGEGVSIRAEGVEPPTS